jgi:hypothetical protein
MNPIFERFVTSLENKFQELITSEPKQVNETPQESGIYLFSEGNEHLYVGRTKNLKRRRKEHVSQKVLDAPFAFRLARENTGNRRATYSKGGSRKDLLSNRLFQESLISAKDRIAQMNYRCVVESDPIKQTLLEIYVAVVLGTAHNDFETH